ncbi:hypothetical protein ACQEVF_33540 [Nonomuraea polychroma]|uniref:hypothetical protein n=1 Tax=Nonomuraea polychroma TaxID=46176 RepID=UPI003D8D5BBB
MRRHAEIAGNRRRGEHGVPRTHEVPYIREVVASGACPQFSRRVVEADDLSFRDQFEFGLACLLTRCAEQVR